MGNNRSFIQFPQNFLWGAAASHFQIEGYPAEIAQRLSDWSQWTELEGKISDATNADRACQFSERYKTDIEIVSQLNFKAYRTSLNWPALMPQKSNGKPQFDPEAVDYYKRLFSELKEKEITVFATLFHFCLPSWLAEEGGWTSDQAVEQFEIFARLAGEHFGEYIDHWITINEPMAYVYQGYVIGNWPPGLEHNYESAFVSVKNMLKAHAVAYHVLKEEQGQDSISFANHWRPFSAEKKWSPMDQLVTFYRDAVFNHMFPKSVDEGEMKIPAPLSSQKQLRKLEGEIPYLKQSMDFLGVNYYTRELSCFEFSLPIDLFGSKSKRYDFSTNDLGWETYPDGFYRVLTQDISRYAHDRVGNKRPVYITENGFARNFDPKLAEGDWSLDDQDRCQYLISHLVVMHKAISEGVNIKGYLHWSLTDNFEWSDGLTPRFGLVRVAYETQERMLRESAKLLAQIAKNNSLEDSSGTGNI